MSIIRMEIEKTRALVSAIRTTGDSLRGSTSTIKSQVAGSDWAGAAKDNFEWEMTPILDAIWDKIAAI